MMRIAISPRLAIRIFLKSAMVIPRYNAVAAFKARIPTVTNCFLSYSHQNSLFLQIFTSVKFKFRSGEICKYVNIYGANPVNHSNGLLQFGSYLNLDHPPTYRINALDLLRQWPQAHSAKPDPS